jgi:hypothetical protein
MPHQTAGAAHLHPGTARSHQSSSSTSWCRSRPPRGDGEAYRSGHGWVNWERVAESTDLLASQLEPHPRGPMRHGTTGASATAKAAEGAGRELVHDSLRRCRSSGRTREASWEDRRWRQLGQASSTLAVVPLQGQPKQYGSGGDMNAMKAVRHCECEEDSSHEHVFPACKRHVDAYANSSRRIPQT